MVASEDKNFIYSLGGEETKDAIDDDKIFRYYCPDDQHCIWQEMETGLKYGREYFVAMAIPEDLVNKLCN